MPLPGGLSNGLIPLVLLEPLPWWEADHLYLERNAARSLGRVAALFLAEHGRPLLVTDAYRPLDVQVRLKIQKGSYAATPGRSEHGWARAVDLASRINVDTSAEHKWMERVGPEHGWHNPPWATDRDPKNGQYEPWHWEYDDETDQHIDDPDEGEDDMGITEDRLRQIIREEIANGAGGAVFKYRRPGAPDTEPDAHGVLFRTLTLAESTLAAVIGADAAEAARDAQDAQELKAVLDQATSGRLDFLRADPVTRAQLTELVDLVRSIKEA